MKFEGENFETAIATYKLKKFIEQFNEMANQKTVIFTCSYDFHTLFKNFF